MQTVRSFMRDSSVRGRTLTCIGWSACFKSAIELAARNRKIRLPTDVTIDAEVDLHLSGGADFLSARMNVSVPDVNREVVQSLVDETHQICPYSKAPRGKIDAAIRLV
jgi:lipoyl-dependent peroxiredoxin